MQIALIGLPQSGKTTIFNALTGGKGQTGRFGSGRSELNIGIGHVADIRLSKLATITKSERVVPAEITYWDVPLNTDSSYRKSGFSAEFLNMLQSADGLLYVVRDFQDPSIPHKEGDVNPDRDVDFIQSELIFSDLLIVERRLSKVEINSKGAKPAERALLSKERDILQKVKAVLELGSSVRTINFSSQEWRELSDYQLLTLKPTMLVFNLGEEHTNDFDNISSLRVDEYKDEDVQLANIFGKIEMELSNIESAHEDDFRSALGVKTSGVDDLLSRTLRLLNNVSFFSVGPRETRAWAVPMGTVAPLAAGKIHSDMERGFIRAEVIDVDDFLKVRSINECKRLGLVHTQGKDYVVQDGDIVNILFNK